MHRTLKYGLQGTALLSVAAGTLVWVAVQKSVDITVDGQSTHVTTVASDVRGALADGGYAVTGHDIVVPAASTSVHDGQQIVLRRGRLIDLDVDGASRQVWTTAPTVADALAGLGYGEGDYTSVSRSTRLAVTGTTIDLRTVKTVTLVHDGRNSTVSTSAPDVHDLLVQMRLSLGRTDRLSVPLTAPLHDGQIIVMTRVVHRGSVSTVALPFPTQTTQDATLFLGQNVVVSPGRAGSGKITYDLVYVNGVLVGRTVTSTVTVAGPSPRVVRNGTKPSNTPAAAQALASSMLASRGWGQDQMSCLVSLWDRESGWRVNAYNPSGAYGIPQALPGEKMAQFGADWQTSAKTQIEWGFGYIASRYGDPCGAWGHSEANNWY